MNDTVDERIVLSDRWVTLISPPRKTYERSAQGRKGRRERLVGRRILFVCCGLDGLDSKRFVYEKAQALGVQVFLAEDPRNTLAQSMEKDGVLTKFIRVSMVPRSSLVSDVVAAVRKVEAEVGEMEAVCCFWDDSVGLYARVCDALGKKGNPVASVDIAHCKHLTRQLMQEVGLPSPKSYLIRSQADVAAAIATVPLPAVLKPVYGAASMGVLKVEKREDVMTTYNEVQRMLVEFYEQGELMGLTFDDASLSVPIGASSTDNKAVDADGKSMPNPLYAKSSDNKDNELLYVIMEEFLDGDEVDVDMLLDLGKVVYCRVCDDWPQIMPWFAEMGNNCPSILPLNIQREIATMAVKTVKAMGFHTGLFHVELKNTSKGPRIIEVNPRMGGGPVWNLHYRAFGIDLIEEQLYASLGLPVNAYAPPKKPRCVSCGEKFYNKTCVISKTLVQIVEEIGNMENVLESRLLLEPGDEVVGIQDGFPTRVARFVVLGENPKDAMRFAESLLARLDVPEMTGNNETVSG